MADKRVCFITGAGRGMGIDIANAALEAGHAVVAIGRNTEAVTDAVGEADDLLVARLDVVIVDPDTVVRLQRAAQQQPRDLVLELPLDRAAQRPRAELRVEADFGKVLDGLVRELDLDVLRPQASRDAVEHQPVHMR
jgi:NAD(P)-dependent dehydrogenase (short-subunit alcohol dehydrogenase family)